MKIAPRAAEIDETEEFPYDVLAELRRADLHAVHVPEEYDGMGADKTSSAIIIGEITRVDTSCSHTPAVNKLGTQGLILSGSEELKRE